MSRFADRTAAGRELADRLVTDYGHRDDVVVLGLPRGGVPVAAVVSAALGAPLDVLVVRKLGVPGHVELAMGAVASGGAQVRNDAVVAGAGVGDATFARVVAAESAEVERRERLYRGERAALRLDAKAALLVDDGLATGASMRSAVMAVRALRPAQVVVGVPVGSTQACRALADVADAVVCARTPAHFRAVGQWYDDFRQTSDDEVRALLVRPTS